MRNAVLTFVVPVLLGAISFAQPPKNSAPSATPKPSPMPQSSQPSASQAQKEFPSPSGYPNPAGGMEILSDTMGVDFRPYVIVMKEKINKRWVELMPKAALPPEMKSGVVILKFSILHNGKVMGLTVEEPSGDKSLDQAAFDALADSSPLPALPESFKGTYLSIRSHFSYNPPKHKQTQAGPSAQSPTTKQNPENK
jgi:TonB family protein